MKPHEERVIAERDSLRQKVVALDTFLGGALWCGLPATDKHLLLAQSAVMKTYLHVLDARIDRFPS